jgi:hypothetical protein
VGPSRPALREAAALQQRRQVEQRASEQAPRTLPRRVPSRGASRPPSWALVRLSSRGAASTQAARAAHIALAALAPAFGCCPRTPTLLARPPKSSRRHEPFASSPSSPGPLRPACS